MATVKVHIVNHKHLSGHHSYYVFMKVCQFKNLLYGLFIDTFSVPKESITLYKNKCLSLL